jgi:hypothetical protein
MPEFATLSKAISASGQENYLFRSIGGKSWRKARSRR